MPGLVALRATSPSIVEVLLDYTRAGPLAQPEVRKASGQRPTSPCLIGTTFMISLRNCCYAAIRYEIMKVAPFSGQVLGPTQTTGAGPLGHLTARGGKSGVWASGKVLILRHFGLVLVLIDQKEGPHPRIHADARFAR